MPIANRSAAAALGAVAALVLGALAWGVLVERNRFTVRRETLPVLEPGAAPLTVLHLADLHLAPWQHRKQQWVRSLADLNPDVVVNTGDNLGHGDALEALEYALEPLRGIPGVFVHGSNDYFGPEPKNPFAYLLKPSGHSERAATLNTAALESFFEDDLGWHSLNNRAAALLINRTRVEFFGVNDAHRGWDRLEALPGAIEAMHENSEDGEETLAVGVTHAPYRRVLDSFVTHGAEVIFAGHTHGGQVRIPGLPALVTNCDIPNAQASGLSVWEHAQRGAFLNVSAGIGTSIYAPVRFACPPEAVLVTLTSGDFSYS
ncbi:MAG: metallophosphoesterase [Salinibacterium sp.]|nr:MAG: metallophosphoesterase [Salinibacterium sp.]